LREQVFGAAVHDTITIPASSGMPKAPWVAMANRAGNMNQNN